MLNHAVSMGSIATGTNGTKNRTLDIGSTMNDNVIWVAGAILHKNQDYTSSASVITFTNNLWNNQNIDVMWW